MELEYFPRRWFVFVVLISLSGLVSLTCGGGARSPQSPTPPFTPTPTVTSVTPAHARIQTDVWIAGQNLLTAGGTAPQVRFDRFFATVKQYSNTELLVVVPSAMVGFAPVTVEVDGRLSNSAPFEALATNFFDGMFDVAIKGSSPEASMTLRVENGQVLTAVRTTTDCLGGGAILVNSKASDWAVFRIERTETGSEYLLEGAFLSQTAVQGTFFMSTIYSNGQCIGPYQWTAQRR